MKKISFFVPFGADVEELRDSINTGLAAGKLIKVEVGKANHNSELFRLILDQARERKEKGYDPNPLTWEDECKTQHPSWAIDRFLLHDGGTYPLLVEGFSTPVRENHKQCDRIEVWNGFSSDPTVPKPACTIQWGTEEDRLLTEIYPKENETFGLELERRLGLQDHKKLFRVKNGSRNVFLSWEGELWVANDTLKDRYDDNPNLTVEAIRSILELAWEAIPMGFRWMFVDQFVFFGDCKNVLVVDPHQRTYYFRWNDDHGKWFNRKDEINRFLEVSLPQSIFEKVEEYLNEVQTSLTRQTVLTLYESIKTIQSGTEDSNELDAKTVAYPNNPFVRIVEDGVEHSTFACGCNMNNRILVDRSVKYRVKPEWEDRVVICHEHFRREAPNPWTFPEGFVDICDVLEDDAEVSAKGRTVYTGAGCTFVSLGGRAVALNNPCNSRTTKDVDDGKGSKISIYQKVKDLPLIDWDRTLAVRPNTTVGDLKAGRFYCWEDGYFQQDNDHQTGKRTSVWMVSPDEAN